MDLWKPLEGREVKANRDAICDMKNESMIAKIIIRDSQWGDIGVCPYA